VPPPDAITIEGARQHNLRGIDVSIPRGRLTVVTGVSGSGKSSLVFDTLYAEGQRRYVESLSTYARQFLGQLRRPRYDRIRGLTPTLAVEQRVAGSNPRSTVGTTTEVLDFLRLLYARAGLQHCHLCGRQVAHRDAAAIVRELLALPEGTRFALLAPLPGDDPAGALDRARRRGYSRALVDGEPVHLGDLDDTPSFEAGAVELLVDRLVARPGLDARLTDSVETSLAEGGGRAVADVAGSGRRAFSERSLCPDCDVPLPALTPALFSFNSPHGMCPACSGLGTVLAMDPDRVVPDPTRPLRTAIVVSGFASVAKGKGWGATILTSLGKRLGFDLDTRFCDLTDDQRQVLLYGLDDELQVEYHGHRGDGTWRMSWEGLLPSVLRRYRETKSDRQRKAYKEFLRDEACPDCDGDRLRAEARAVTVAGRPLPRLLHEPISALRDWFAGLDLPGEAAAVAGEVRGEVVSRLGFLDSVGVGYLSLERSGATLSGGEAQRIRLAGQIGSELTGVTYVLDEPTVGLHPRDTERLLEVLYALRDLGNTVVVVEHDRDTITAADHVIEIGPGAGAAGGEVVFTGPPDALGRAVDSPTGAFLSGREKLETPARRRPTGGPRLVVRRPTARNLTGEDVALPLSCLVAVTGVSGAGKSTLVDEVLYPALARRLMRAKAVPGPHRGLDGVEHLDKVVRIDQRPIGRTPRSNPATYTKAFDAIRSLFAAVPEARARGWGARRFSLNTKGGRCEPCRGEGARRIEMVFLPDVTVPCDACGGRRFNEATLQVTYKGLDAARVLELPCEEARDVFSAHPGLSRILGTLCDVGLGYLSLGQPSTTLSGGEAQRVKLARELARPDTGRTLYVLDEPTTGLHAADVRRLVEVLDRLVDAGNTVVVVEHNLDLVRCADWVIDLGPEAGDGGGRVVAAGPPEEVAGHPESRTAPHLRRALDAA